MKYTSRIVILYALGLLLSTTACQLESLSDPIVVTDIEDEFYIDMWETAAAVNQFEIRVETIENEACLDVEIDALALQRPNALDIQLNDIIEPTDCIEGEAPATAQLNLGNLPNGLYDFSIELKGAIFNDGQLTIAPDRYILDMESEDGIILFRSQLLRIPEQIFWGYVNFEAGMESLADAFINELQALTIPTNFLRGYYGYFTVNNDVNDVSVTNQPIDFTMQPFVHRYDRGTQDELMTLADTYRQQGLEIWLQNDLGEEF